MLLHFKVKMLTNFCYIGKNFRTQRPNLKNLSRGSNVLVRLKFVLIFQDLSRRSIETGFWGIQDEV